jgi:hypothetical protein
MNTKNRKSFLASTICLLMIAPVSADVTSELIQEYKTKGATTALANRGASLWEKDVNGRSCTSCHTTSVKNTGKHQKTGKLIKPMAPSVNPQRLTKKRKVKKWLLRNCKWTFKRECNAQEKSDILLWLSQQ